MILKNMYKSGSLLTYSCKINTQTHILLTFLSSSSHVTVFNMEAYTETYTVLLLALHLLLVDIKGKTSSWNKITFVHEKCNIPKIAQTEKSCTIHLSSCSVKCTQYSTVTAKLFYKFLMHGIFIILYRIYVYKWLYRANGLYTNLLWHLFSIFSEHHWVFTMHECHLKVWICMTTRVFDKWW